MRTIKGLAADICPRRVRIRFPDLDHVSVGLDHSLCTPNHLEAFCTQFPSLFPVQSVMFQVDRRGGSVVLAYLRCKVSREVVSVLSHRMYGLRLGEDSQILLLILCSPHHMLVMSTAFQHGPELLGIGAYNFLLFCVSSSRVPQVRICSPAQGELAGRRTNASIRLPRAGQCKPESQIVTHKSHTSLFIHVQSRCNVEHHQTNHRFWMIKAHSMRNPCPAVVSDHREVFKVQCRPDSCELQDRMMLNWHSHDADHIESHFSLRALYV